MAEWYSIAYSCHIVFIHSSVDEHLDCFHVLTVVNSAPMNSGIHGSFQIMVFSCYVPRTGIFGSYGDSIFNVLRNLHSVLHSGCSVQFSSVAQLCLTLCYPMNRSMPGLPVHHQLPGFTPTHVHQVSDAIQPSYPLLSPSSPAPNPSQHQSIFRWVNSSHEVAQVLEF